MLVTHISSFAHNLFKRILQQGHKTTGFSHTQSKVFAVNMAQFIGFEIKKLENPQHSFTAFIIRIVEIIIVALTIRVMFHNRVKGNNLVYTVF